jgi:hypothetical protein
MEKLLADTLLTVSCSGQMVQAFGPLACDIGAHAMQDLHDALVHVSDKKLNSVGLRLDMQADGATKDEFAQAVALRLLVGVNMFQSFM